MIRKSSNFTVTFEPWFFKIVNHLWKNRAKFIFTAAPNTERRTYFEYPDYAGIPTDLIRNIINTNVADAIDDVWNALLDGRFETKKAFIDAVINNECWNPLEDVCSISYNGG